MTLMLLLLLTSLLLFILSPFNELLPQKWNHTFESQSSKGIHVKDRDKFGTQFVNIKFIKAR